jgi:hypothetical protein
MVRSDYLIHRPAVVVSEGRHAYVLVNNRAERNAPLTVQGSVSLTAQGLVEMLCG